MTITNLTYSATGMCSKIPEIQRIVKKGFIPKIVNKNTSEVSYIINYRIFESILNYMEIKSVIEFDEDLSMYTVFNEILLHICGEGNSVDEAIEEMTQQAKSFAVDYAENLELFSNIMDGIQQFLLGSILLNLEDDDIIRDILKVS